MEKRISLTILVTLTFLQLFSQNNQSTKPEVHIPYVDIHVHPGIKAFNSRHLGEYDLWSTITHDCDGGYANWMVNGSKGLPRYSQSNFESLMNGNFRVIGYSMTPIERGFYSPRLLNLKKKGAATFACISGVMVEPNSLKLKDDVQYFPILKENIDFVIEGEKKPHLINDVAHSYEVVQSKSHLQRLLKEANKMAVVLNIEGGHVLGHSLENKDVSDQPDFHKKVIQNLLRLKGVKPLNPWQQKYLKHPIFSMGINHFYWNGLGGHAKAFDFTQTLVFGGSKGLNEPISDLGKKVIKLMINDKKGRRIIPDAKHMSVASRTWYYSLLDSLKADGIHVPILFSHAAVTGLSISDSDFLKKDKNGKSKDSYFNQWQINLANEEIQRVADSKGLIGIMLDKYRLCGGKAVELMEATEVHSEARRKIAIKIIAMNFLQVAKVAGKKGWDIVCIGTDYDGMMKPFAHYMTSEELGTISQDLYEFFSNPEDVFEVFTKEEVKELMYGYSAEKLVQKIMSENGIQFYITHFPKNNRADQF